MTWLKNFSFKKLFSNKKFALAFSLIVAFVFWLVIVIDQNPEMPRTFNNVPVSITAAGTNLEALNMEVVSKNIGDTAAVTIKGPSYVVSTLKADDILVTVDLSGIEQTGEYTLNLVAKKISGKTDYEFVSINPTTVTILVDKIVDEYIDAVVEAPGVTVDLEADSNLGIEPLTIDDKIHIKGPQSEFAKIASVKAIISDEVALSASKSFNAVIKLFDANGKELDTKPFVLSSESVTVTAKVFKRATLPLKLVFTNKPAGAPDLNYTITLDTGEVVKDIDIQGEPDVINTLSAVELAPIDFSTISINNTNFDVALNLFTESIKSSDNISTVKVSFNLKDYRQKGIAVNLDVINAPSNLTIDRTSLRSVTFTVPKNIVKSFDSSDVTGVVDLSGKNAGDSVSVTFKSKLNGVWVNGTYNVTVKEK